MAFQFFTAKITDGDSEVYNRKSKNRHYVAGTLAIVGPSDGASFGGATVKILVSQDGNTWYTANNGAKTAQYVDNIEWYAPFIKLNVSGSTGVALSAWFE